MKRFASRSQPVQSKERDVLLFLLAVSAGCSDGWSFLGLGHAFVANMTGNTVLLGIAVFQKGRDLLHPAIALGCYLVGVAIASMITRRIAPGQVWPRAISWTLLLEALLLTGAEVAWVMRSHEIQGAASLSLNWMLASVAVAIGLQSGAMVQLNIPGIVTT